MKLLIPTFLLLLVASGCKKEGSENNVSGLPDTSSFGRHFVACRVNGQAHVYTGHRSVANDDGVNYSLLSYGILIHADQTAYKDDFNIAIIDSSSPKVNTLYKFSNEFNSKGRYYFDAPPQMTYTSIINSGWIRFSRLDTAVAAGTFAFTAYLNGTPGADSVVITDGRFDISAK